MAEKSKSPSLWETIKANTTTPGGSGIMKMQTDKGATTQQAIKSVEQSRKLNYGK